MKVLVRLLPLIITFSFDCTAMIAQERPAAPPRPEAQLKAIARLDYMVGNWTGEGWIEFGDRRVAFRGSELVQEKLGGTVLLVEGSFFAKIGPDQREVPVHTTLGVISFDPKSQTYRFASWLATGMSGEREIKLIEDGWQWDVKGARGTTRYTLRFADGEWHEIGERSTDGTAWKPFFEMKLRKKS